MIAVYLRSNTQQHINSSTHALDELLGNSLVSSERLLFTRLARNGLRGSWSDWYREVGLGEVIGRGRHDGSELLRMTASRN